MIRTMGQVQLLVLSMELVKGFHKQSREMCKESQPDQLGKGGGNK